MKILEFEAKTLLADQGLPVPQGKFVLTFKEAEAVAAEIGRPVVVKAQIPGSGRMKAGGVHFADKPAEAAAATRDLLGRDLLGHPVQTVLVEEKLATKTEVFIGVTYDGHSRRATVLTSREGGVDVGTNHHVIQRSFSILRHGPDYVGREVAAALALENRASICLCGLINRLIECFIQWDTLLLEINPLIMDNNGKWWIADVHMELDDDAAYRQGDLLARLPISAREANRRTAFERKAIEIDSADHRGVAGRLVPFGGNLGLLIGGGGASLTIMDALLDAGLKPANYCEIGGNPSVWKVKELTKLILNQDGVDQLAVIMNVVSNTRVDLVARGVIKGILELNLKPRDVVVAFRIPGSWEHEGESILRHYGVPFFRRDTSIDQVVESIQWLS